MQLFIDTQFLLLKNMTFKDLSHLTPSLEKTPPAKETIAHRQIHVKVERSGAISANNQKKGPTCRVAFVFITEKSQ